MDSAYNSTYAHFVKTDSDFFNVGIRTTPTAELQKMLWVRTKGQSGSGSKLGIAKKQGRTTLKIQYIRICVILSCYMKFVVLLIADMARQSQSSTGKLPPF